MVSIAHILGHARAVQGDTWKEAQSSCSKPALATQALLQCDPSQHSEWAAGNVVAVPGSWGAPACHLLAPQRVAACLKPETTLVPGLLSASFQSVLWWRHHHHYPFYRQENRGQGNLGTPTSWKPLPGPPLPKATASPTSPSTSPTSGLQEVSWSSVISPAPLRSPSAQLMVHFPP